MSDALASELPRGRAFSKIEAMYSLQLDYDRGSRVTIAGMAARWGWSRNKVTRFLDEVGVVILYPETTSKKQNQKGQIAIQIRDRCRADNEQIKIIDNKGLADKKSRKRADTGQIKDRSRNTTNQTTNPNPKKERGESAQHGSKRGAQEVPKPLTLKNPGFSDHFMAEVWTHYLKVKAGKPYKNRESQEVALRQLYKWAGGDEQEAVEALAYAVASSYQGFQWYFSDKQKGGKRNAADTKHNGNPHAKANAAAIQALQRSDFAESPAGAGSRSG